jgi:hypothetical protein
MSSSTSTMMQVVSRPYVRTLTTTSEPATPRQPQYHEFSNISDQIMKYRVTAAPTASRGVSTSRRRCFINTLLEQFSGIAPSISFARRGRRRNHCLPDLPTLTLDVLPVVAKDRLSTAAVR